MESADARWWPIRLAWPVIRAESAGFCRLDHAVGRRTMKRTRIWRFVVNDTDNLSLGEAQTPWRRLTSVAD
jgi:hypothetical protein